MSIEMHAWKLFLNSSELNVIQLTALNNILIEPIYEIRYVQFDKCKKNQKGKIMGIITALIKCQMINNDCIICNNITGDIHKRFRKKSLIKNFHLHQKTSIASLKEILKILVLVVTKFHFERISSASFAFILNKKNRGNYLKINSPCNHRILPH